MIIKPLDGSGGSGVFYLNNQDRNTNAILEAATDNGREWSWGSAICRKSARATNASSCSTASRWARCCACPLETETRGNIHVGGQCVRTEVTERDREICAALSPLLRADGLYFVGLDVIGNYLTEVNVTSPTGIQEINALDGVRLESQVIDFVEQRVEKIRNSRALHNLDSPRF